MIFSQMTTSWRDKLSAHGAIDVPVSGEKFDAALRESREAMRTHAPARARVKQITVPEDAEFPKKSSVDVRVLVDAESHHDGALKSRLPTLTLGTLVVNSVKLENLVLKERSVIDGRVALLLSGSSPDKRDLPLLRSFPLSVKASLRDHGDDLSLEGFELFAPR
jgi:hypothetical protein